MSKLTIKDLETNRELDREAASSILGGINEWIAIASPRPRSIAPMSVTNIYNTSIDNDYIMIQPQVYNIGNNVSNSSNISYNLSPQFVSAASPIYLMS